jgi:AcrR family transcriptional regulator
VVARRYEQRRRAEQQTETRRRIVEAAIELHRTVGPAATTMSDIADWAGVSRVTVYRHFPDELSLSFACSGLYMQRNPLPDPESWRAIADPEARFRIGVGATYAYHGANRDIFARALGEARDAPAMGPYHAHWLRAADILAAPWRRRGRRRRELVAGIALALSFDTWRTLTVEQGLTEPQAVELMLRVTRDGAAG